MIWATVSSRSCFCWLYTDFGIDYLVTCLCRVMSCVVGKGCFLWPVLSVSKILLDFALLHFVFQGQTYLLLQVPLDFLLWYSSPMATHSTLLPGKFHGWRSLMGCNHGVRKSWTRLSDFAFTFHFHALKKDMETHSSALAWRIPGTVEPGGLWSRGSHKDWSDLIAAAAAWWKRYPFLVLVLEGLVGLHRTGQLQLLWH